MKTKLSVAPKAEPQKTEGERLRHLDINLDLMAERLSDLAPHIDDLGDLLYQTASEAGCGDKNSNILNAASNLLAEYSTKVADYATWAKELQAEAEGKQEQKSA
jgi:hypothetical protein